MKRIMTLILGIMLVCSLSYATVTDQTQRVQYTATADQTVFAYTWRVLDDGDMDVFVDGVLTTAYSVSNVGILTGGNVTFNTARTSGEIITILRNMPNSQETVYPAGGKLSTVNLELNLDRLTMFVQDLDEILGRAPTLPGSSTQSGIVFPEGTSATDRATKVPAWNDAGTDLELIASTNVDATSVIAVKGDMVQGNPSGTAAKLAIGAADQVMSPSSGSVAYLDPRNVCWNKGNDISGTAALAVPDENANYFDVTGTPTVTSIAATNLDVGGLVRFHFDTIGTFTHNSSDLALPGGNNVTISVGDEFTFIQYATDDYRLIGSTSTGSAVPALHTHEDANNGGDLGQVQATDVTITGASQATPDANTITKDMLVGARCTINNNAGTPEYLEEVNFTGSITDNGIGNYTLSIDRDFANANYSYVTNTTGNANFSSIGSPAVGSIVIFVVNHAGTSIDADTSVVLFGEQ